ncbi:hypothetical protein ABHA64_06330, partial [Enterococcus faecalis]
MIPFLTTMMLINFGLPVAAAAESLDSLQEKEAQAKQSGELISKEINSALDLSLIHISEPTRQP